MKSTGVGSRDQTWRHRRRNWVRSFEYGLSKILGLNWWEAAKFGRSSWKKGKYHFFNKAVRCWGGPRVTWKKAFLENLAPIVDVGSSEDENRLNSFESMLALLSSLIVSVFFHGVTGGQEHSCCLQHSCARPLVPTLSSLSRLFSVLVLHLAFWILKVPDAPGVLHFEFRTLNGFLKWLEAFAHSCVLRL